MMTTTRYVGLDIHKRHVTIAAVNDQQDVILAPQKVPIPHFASWVQIHLSPTDRVALEATTNAWTLHDQLKPLVETVAVANTFQLKLIGASASKTDKQDALVLAKLLAAHLLPAVWVPPQPVRELRDLIAHRRHLVRDRTCGGYLTRPATFFPVFVRLPSSTRRGLALRPCGQLVHIYILNIDRISSPDCERMCDRISGGHLSSLAA